MIAVDRMIKSPCTRPNNGALVLPKRALVPSSLSIVLYRRLGIRGVMFNVSRMAGLIYLENDQIREERGVNLTIGSIFIADKDIYFKRYAGSDYVRSEYVSERRGDMATERKSFSAALRDNGAFCLTLANEYSLPPPPIFRRFVGQEVKRRGW